MIKKVTKPTCWKHLLSAGVEHQIQPRKRRVSEQRRHQAARHPPQPLVPVDLLEGRRDAVVAVDAALVARLHYRDGDERGAAHAPGHHPHGDGLQGRGIGGGAVVGLQPVEGAEVEADAGHAARDRLE